MSSPGYTGMMASGLYTMPIGSGYLTMGGYTFTGDWHQREDRRKFVFKAEQRSELERDFLLRLYDNPKDTAARAAYSDWLEENNRPESAKALRDGWTPGVN